MRRLGLSPLRIAYLALTLWGAARPLARLSEFLSTRGADPAALAAAWQANALGGELAWNPAIASLTLTVWAMAETRVRGNWSALWALPGCYLLGPSFGLPLYLFLRSRPIT